MSFKNPAAILALSASLAAAQEYTFSNSEVTTTYQVSQDTGGDTPLASKNFEWPDLPYQADSGDGPRGTQQGYNICNATTAGDDSMCQTAFINSIDDLCLWGSPVTGDEEKEEAGTVEGEMVAYCTNANHGTRVIPEGTIQGLQFLTAPDYIEIVGTIDQTGLGFPASDYGGEEDPHGADGRGNPLGSLLFTSAFGKGEDSDYKQVTEWNFFIGSGLFCFKACNPDSENARELCNNVYDRIGCEYNMPASYDQINGTFAECESENQMPVGEYVSDGNTVTWQQPPESLGAISSIPYTPSPPATSSCKTHSSEEVIPGTAAASASGGKASGSGSAAASAATSGGDSASGDKKAQASAGSDDSSDEDSGASSLAFGFVPSAGFLAAALFAWAVAQ